MATGKVKWFNNAKGYGFVLPDTGGEDLFVHYSSIEMDGYKTLRAGDDVEFDVHEGPKGLHAVNIRAAGMTAGGAVIVEDVDVNGAPTPTRDTDTDSDEDDTDLGAADAAS